MAAEIKHLGGVGAHATFAVLVQGRRVATISRYSSRTGWSIRTYYHVELASGYKTVTDAKVKAMNLVYPSKVEIYERVCKDVEQFRRRHAECNHAHEMAEALRGIAGVEGLSSAAMHKADEILASIEAYATDKSDSGDRGWGHERRYPIPPEAE